MWALTLLFLTFTKLLVLTTGTALEGEPTQTQMWLAFGLNILLMAGFGSSVYGLFKKQAWGRIVFLWSVSIWAGFNLIAMLLPLFSANPNYSQNTILNAVRYLAAFFIPLWYLNLPQVKMAFQPSLENSIEDIQTDDNIT